jgi:2-keto-4-pentenoate hydratase/2-oxohepta-3-ene-1,7-dioic acid hydratase in catechol pathway
MKVGAIIAAGELHPAVVRSDGHVIDLTATGLIGAPADVLDVMRTDAARVSDAVTRAGAHALIRGDLRWGPPIRRPGKIICLAGNYREHIVESGYQAVGEREAITPQLFMKPSTCVIGDRDPIPFRAPNERIGWEAELGVVIGRCGRDIPAARALEYVWGYTVVNDLSERRLHADMPGRKVRERDPFFDWLTGKWFDGFLPCGPWLVTADEVTDPHALEIRLWVNGELRQQGTSADMIFRIPETIAAISSVMTLEPGDVIATGTPAGAGIGSGAAFLSDGDEVVCEIAGIGRLTNRVQRIA